MSDDGLLKAAILLLALGEDEAAEVMKHLGPREVQKLGATMATLKSVGHDEVDSVLTQFVNVADEKASFSVDSDDYIRSVLTKALGDDKASGLIGRILQSRDSNGIEGLKWMDGQTVADLIRNEHPQIIATILVHLEPDQASEILSYFNDRLRQDVILRIATLDGVKPLALKELNEVLTKLLSGNENLNKKQIGGIRAAAEIMNFMNGENEASMMEAIKTYDADMAQKIMDEMFIFDDIVQIDDKGIQTILREVQSESLIVALKGATEEIREKIFKNMSSRAAEMMKEDLETKGPIKLSEVEAQQKQILQIVRRLADEGQLMLGGKGGDDQYV
jgi:flagellar motor switch protein FliG